MPVTLIEQNPGFHKTVETPDKLSISEMFCDTLQGEGLYAGITATFIRLQGCTLVCTWCDTLNVWPNGNQYSFDEIFDMFESIDLITRFKQGQHMILTGGSPLKQQDAVIKFIEAFITKYGFKPFIEVENEAVLMPKPELSQHVDCWNNSPKLDNSGMKLRARLKPEIIKHMSSLPNSWFKFVVSNQQDWNEIQTDFIDTEILSKSQIIVMPEGQNQEQLKTTREFTADIAISNNVRFSDRLHITIWDKKTGV